LSRRGGDRSACPLPESPALRHVRLPAEARPRFRRIAARAGADGALRAPAMGPDLARRLRSADWNVEEPARWLIRSLNSPLRRAGDADRRAALARLALAFPQPGRDVLLPPSIRALYPRAFDRLERALTSGAPYPWDGFVKDARLVLGLSVPAGAQDVDVAFGSGAPALLGRLRRGSANLVRVAAAGEGSAGAVLLLERPLEPWLQIHTDSRYLDDFDPAGWDHCYRRVADLLRRNPVYAGMVGQSWFYDPAVAGISPRLAYLQERPLQNGAVRVRLGAGPRDVERATATSETRRQLYAQGRYRPRCYAIYWPREALIAWADRVSAPEVRRPKAVFAVTAAR
jgi:hypothetical protein